MAPCAQIIRTVSQKLVLEDTVVTVVIRTMTVLLAMHPDYVKRAWTVSAGTLNGKFAMNTGFLAMSAVKTVIACPGCAVRDLQQTGLQFAV